MTSPISSNTLSQTGNIASASASQSTSANSSSQQGASGRGFVGNNGNKRQNSTTTAHSKTESLSNGKAPFLPAVPSLGGHTPVNGNNAVNNTATSFDHSRKPSVTITAAGATGQLPNGGPMAGKSPVSNSMPVFGSMNANSPNMASSNLQSSGSLNPHSSNPRITSPQQSPSPIPQPSASGGKPPSSLQNSSSAVSFGNFGPEEPNRQSNSSISGVSSGQLTPNMGPVPLRRESSQQSNSDNSMGMNGSRGGYHGGRGRGGGYQGNHISHQPYSPNPSYRQMNNPRSAGPNSQFPQGNRAFSYQGPGTQNRSSPAPHYVQPVTPGGTMGMVSPGMQGQPQYYQSNMGQPVNHPISFKSSTAPKSLKDKTSNAAPENVSAQYHTPAVSFQPVLVALPTTLSPESGQFEQFLTLRKQGFFAGPDGMYYPAPYTPYGIAPQMQLGQQYYNPSSPRPPQAMTPSQGQFLPNQYGPPSSSMSRTPSGIGERSNSVASQPPSTPMTPSVHLNNPPASRPSPAPKQSAFIVPKKTGGIKIVNPNTREELKIEKPPESPAIIPASRSPATVSTNPTPPSRTPDSHARTDSLSLKNQSDIAKKFKADIESKLNAEKAEAEKAEAEKAKQQAEVDDEKQSEEDDEDEQEPEDVKPSEAKEEVKPAESVKSSDSSSAESGSSGPTHPIIVEPPKEDVKEPERELTEDDDEYWAKIEAEELAKEEEAERLYQEKKKLQDAEKNKKEAEENAKREAESKRREAEEEAIEEEKERKRKQGVQDDSDAALFAELKKSDHAFKPTETPGESSGVATPTSDASSSMAPPAKTAGPAKSKPLPLKLETSKQVEAPTPSAALQSLRSARFLTRIDDRMYPAAIASPNPALNSAAPMGKFRYDKNFLMQFQNVFTEKPSETWSDKIRETVGDADTPQTSKGGRSHTIGGSLNRGASTPKSTPGGPFGLPGGMGTFNRAGTSEQRFALSTKQLSNKQPYAMSHPNAFPGGFPGSSNMIRSTSSTSVGHPQSPRNNPSRGGRGGSRAGANPKHDAKANAAMPLTAGKEVQSLKVSESGWKPIHVGQNVAAGPPPGGETGYLAPDVVQRKVKSNLNKMTPTTFEKITGQIIEIVMQSKQETDGRTLRQVIQLTFEKATDESHWAQMYAEFCSRMLHSMTTDIRDETLGLDKNGNVTAGNTLFRRYLLNRCQQDFEAGWKSKLPEAPGGENAEAALLSDEYYAAAAAKRRGLGLVKFIGELYKLGMLTSRIMVMCVQRLLEYDGTPEEAEIESLSSLLNTIGEGLDHDDKSRPAMDAFFIRIGDILKIESLPSRMRFMLMDLVDLRRANWKSKTGAAKGPATIDQIHAQAAAAEREKEAQRILEAQRSRGPGGGGSNRLPMGRGDARFPGQMAPPPQSNSVGMDDLRRLGRSSSRQTSAAAGPVSFGPQSMFNQRGSNTGSKKTLGVLGRAGDDSNASSRTGTPPAQKKDDKDNKGSTNAFSALAALDANEGADGPASPPSTAASPALSNARPGIARNRSKSPLKDEDTGN